MSLHRIHKKIQKLFRDPKQFFLDSKIRKFTEAELLTRNIRGLFDNKSLSEKSFRSCKSGNFFQEMQSDLLPREQPLTIDTIKTELSSQALVFYIDDYSVNKPVICIIESELSNYINSLVRICHSHSLKIFYNKNKKLYAPKTLREIYRDLSTLPVIDIKLVDKRSTATFYFEIQIWKEFEDYFMAPKANMISRKVWKRSFKDAGIPTLTKQCYLSDIIGTNLDYDIQFDIDYVFTWVNDQDENWRKLYNSHKPGSTSDSNSLSRFYNRDELKYSLRAIDMYAPWVRRIHIVSNCKPPLWLNIDHPKVNWVYHEQIFSPEILPTFSSHAIESRLHKISGLSNHFIYSNDDFMLSRPTHKTDFFEPNGLCKIRFEPYGNVNGDININEQDYLNAARNCQKLIEIDFNISPTQLHCHAPQALRKDILEEMELKYQKEFSLTASSKFRSIADIAVTGFLFHHYTYVTGRGIKDYTKTMLIQQNHNFSSRYKMLLDQKDILDKNKRYLSFCINDGADSHLNDKWNKQTSHFLDAYFSCPSSFEFDGNV